MTPRELMTEIGLDASALDLGKYNPDQPRVPAGSRSESGRWTEGVGGAESEFRSSGQASPGASHTVATKPLVQQSPKLVQIATNGPFHPAGVNVVPVPPGDMLVPQGLNRPLSLAEQQAIADTFNTILTGRPQDILKLEPHGYDNKPSINTGAFYFATYR